MKIFKIFVTLALAVASSAVANAQEPAPGRVVVKAMAEIGLTDGMSLSSDMNMTEKKTSTNNFGLDLGYKFWAHKRASFDINAGFGYGVIRNKLGVDDIQYSYHADPDADQDGNSYVRYYEVEGIRQNVETKSYTVPLYLTFNIACCEWLTFHIDAGAQMRFKTSSKVKGSSANYYAYGIYPEYDNLMIDAAWLNNFGHNRMEDAPTSNVVTNSLTTSLIFGGGLEVMLIDPLWIDLGVRYSSGLNDVFVNKYSGDLYSSSNNVPMSYTVANGETVNSLTGYLTKSRLSGLSLRLGLVFRF
ncbi:MAG: outer membrane beta-barrel protein [Muribaculaceae bacterium]|nr:outer membrane beta-barrel protein [Muribaculaceae bacterium]